MLKGPVFKSQTHPLQDNLVVIKYIIPRQIQRLVVYLNYESQNSTLKYHSNLYFNIQESAQFQVNLRQLQFLFYRQLLH